MRLACPNGIMDYRDQVKYVDERSVHAQQALLASELSYRRLFEAAKDGILILDLDTGRISDVNPFLVNLLGFSHGEMLGKTVGELSPFRDFEENEVMLSRLQKDGYVRYENLPLETKGGRKIAVEFVSNVYEAGDKKVIQCNIRDITERNLAQMALKNSQAQLRALSARLHSVREDEATRIAREIHDELGQRLAGLKMDLLWTERKLGELANTAEVNALLDRVVGTTELVEEIIVSVQRIAAELRPGVLDKLGLGSALQSEARRFQDRSGLACVVRVPATEPILPPEMSTTFFRILQEGLTNVLRHARASKVDIELKAAGGWVTMRVRDNGRGITQSEITSPHSLGLVGMRERAAMLGGKIVFCHGRDKGTILTTRIPNPEILPAGKERSV